MERDATFTPQPSGVTDSTPPIVYWLVSLEPAESVDLTVEVPAEDLTFDELVAAQDEALVQAINRFDELAAPLVADLGAPLALRAAPPPELRVDDRENDEQATIDVPIDLELVDVATLTAQGMPKGLRLQNGRFTGVIAHDAADATEDRRAIEATDFAVTLTGERSDGAIVRTDFVWKVRDTHRVMPNFVGKFGCDCGDIDNDVSVLTDPVFDCIYAPDEQLSTIARQSVAPGTVVAWGAVVRYWYFEDDPTCEPA